MLPNTIKSAIYELGNHMTGMAEPGGRTYAPQILAGQVTLSQPEGADYAPHITACPSEIFRPNAIPA